MCKMKDVSLTTTRMKPLIFPVLDFAFYGVSNINLLSLLIVHFHRRNLANNIGAGEGGGANPTMGFRKFTKESS